MIKSTLLILTSTLLIASSLLWTQINKNLNEIIKKREKRIGELMKENSFLLDRMKAMDTTIGEKQREIERLIRENEVLGDDGK